MSLFDIFKKINDADKNNKIVYDYNNIDIKKNDIVFDNKTINLKIPVTFPVNVPNVTYPNSLNNYNATNIYISSIIHNNITQISSTSMAELIIEHKTITGFGTLYTCFLLEFINGSKDVNDLDKLISMYNSKNTKNTKNILFNLNKTIPTQDYCIIYKPTNSITAMVFTTPIYLNQNSYDILLKNKIGANNLFSNYNANYIVLPKANISQRGEEEIYIDCTPTGESAETIATYNVPIQSEYTRDWGKLDFMKMTIQLLMVFILLLTTYFGVPIMYKRVVVDNISRLISNEIHSIRSKDGRIYAGKQIRNITVDWVLSIFSSLIIGFSFLFSISSKNYNYLQYTVYLFIFGILSMAIIAFNKSSGYFKEGYINKDLFDIEKYDQKDVSSKKLSDILKFLGDIGSFLGEAFVGKDNKKDVKNWAMVGGFLTFTYIFLIIFRWGIRTLNHTTFLFLCWFLPFFVVIPSSLIAVLNLYKLETNPIPKS
jgi:hypothetical protein